MRSTLLLAAAIAVAASQATEIVPFANAVNHFPPRAACSACLILHMAMKLKRKLYWDPQGERFQNDDGANALLSRRQRPPCGIA